MSDAVLIAILGAAFNAGVLWGTMTAINSRIARLEHSADRAHDRINSIHAERAAPR